MRTLTSILPNLRDLDRKPLTKEAYQKLGQHLLASLKTSIGKEYTLKEITSAAQCLSGEPKPLTSCITNEADFSKALASYLVKLACRDPDVARGVTRRVLEEIAALAELATALLEANCEAVKKLPEDIQESLLHSKEVSLPPRSARFVRWLGL